MTTPTAHSSFCIVFSGFVLGLAVWGIITAEAVMLFFVLASLRGSPAHGASHALTRIKKPVPCATCV
ncbi:hypothetical protein CKQ90_15510 [Klebsiella pneumoniae]|nr:hypothetical protein CKQ90_15510 [Klebsiella pneumoniae]